MLKEEEIAVFLAQAGWAGAARQDFGADFSARRFARLTDARGARAILMISPPEHKTASFVSIGKALRAMGLPAPEIYAADAARDLVLMEDFGDALCGPLIEAGADRTPMDRESARLLAHLHECFDPKKEIGVELPVFDAALFTQQAGFFLDYAIPRLFGRPATLGEREGFNAAWLEVLRPLEAAPRSLLLRDYMPDNALNLAAPVLGWSLGVIDFQDAGLGPMAYDIGSWCEDVRREGGLERLEPMIDFYASFRPEADKAQLRREARVLLAQRYTRILGRLVYLQRENLAARVRRVLLSLLQDDALAPARRWFEESGVQA